MKPALLVIDVQTHFFDEPVSVKSLEGESLTQITCVDQTTILTRRPGT